MKSMSLFYPIALVSFVVWNLWQSTRATTSCGRTTGEEARFFHMNTSTTPTRFQTTMTQQRRLEFVHIPKTGGTAIESLAAKHGIAWSICHFALPQIPPTISGNATHCPPGSLKHLWPTVRKLPAHIPWWHVPPQYFELEWLPYQSPYSNADLFAVVRNPYDRVLSEYYYHQSLRNDANESWVNSPVSLEQYLRKILQKNILQAQRGRIAKNITGNRFYFASSGHFIPQYDYVFYDDDDEDHGGQPPRQIIKHVLKFESLERDFADLMDSYNLSHIRLSQMGHVRRPNSVATRKLTAHDIPGRFRKMIEHYYAKDFQAFGYNKLGPSA